MTPHIHNLSIRTWWSIQCLGRVSSSVELPVPNVCEDTSRRPGSNEEGKKKPDRVGNWSPSPPWCADGYPQLVNTQRRKG